MFDVSENTEVNETPESSDETEDMDADLEADLDGKCEEYSNGGRSIEDIRRDKEELIQMKEDLMRYKEAQEADMWESDDDENEDPEKVLTLRRNR